VRHSGALTPRLLRCAAMCCGVLRRVCCCVLYSVADGCVSALRSGQCYQGSWFLAVCGSVAERCSVLQCVADGFVPVSW